MQLTAFYCKLIRILWYELVFEQFTSDLIECDVYLFEINLD